MISDYSKLNSHFQGLEDLVDRYPYSQPVRMLNVKSSSALKKEEYQKRLALAAFYSTDRTVLRSLIEKGKVPSDIRTKHAPSSKAGTRPVRKAAKARSSEKHLDIDLLRKEILLNLETLQKTKTSFLQNIGEEIERETVPEVKASATKAKPVTEPKKTVTKKEPATKQSTRTARRANKNDLIDKFIADKPSIKPSQEVRENQSDLSKASGELREDLVSENLALIFARQGKTEKAIEIYKRLIWKFPQKKASFAARIEELKKK